jgi:hypothetical protein
MRGMVRGGLRFFAVLAALAIGVGLGAGCRKKSRVAVSKEAEGALDPVRKMITKDNYETLGFRSFEEVGRMSLGDPITVYKVGLPALRHYQAGTDPERLLADTGTVYYPVMVGDDIRSMIEMKKTNVGWRSEAFGMADFAVPFVHMEMEVAATAKVPRSDLFAVRIPGMSHDFVGYRRNGTIELVPLRDASGFHLVAGEARPAADVFAEMAPAARDRK